ncbi:MAG: energy transducer TonB [Kiritimatiellia bacterium]|nr:energy transducer TonB [Kiritimatiellia bacterium]
MILTIIFRKKFGRKIEESEENNPANLSIASRDIRADKLAAAPSPGHVINTKHRVKGGKPALFLAGDTRTKGIAGGLAANSGVHPYYPLGARLRGEEGTVKVEICVGANGCVLNCAVIKSSGFSALDDAAVDAVKRTQFVSAKALSIQKESKTILTFQFDLID